MDFIINLFNLLNDWSILLAIIGYLVKEYITRRRHRRLIATSLFAEIESLQERYYDVTDGGVKLEMVIDRSTFMTLEARQNYFTVFENSTNDIGFLEPRDVAAVIDFYVNAKGLIDTFASFESAFLRNENINTMPFMAVLMKQETKTMTKADNVKKILQNYIEKNTSYFGI